MHEITLSEKDFSRILQAAVEAGVAEYIKKSEPSKDLLSQRKAYKLFGEARVKRWHQIGVITARRGGDKTNSKKLYSYAELLLADKTERSNPIANK